MPVASHHSRSCGAASCSGGVRALPRPEFTTSVTSPDGIEVTVADTHVTCSTLAIAKPPRRDPPTANPGASSVARSIGKRWIWTVALAVVVSASSACTSTVVGDAAPVPSELPPPGPTLAELKATPADSCPLHAAVAAAKHAGFTPSSSVVGQVSTSGAATALDGVVIECGIPAGPVDFQIILVAGAKGSASTALIPQLQQDADLPMSSVQTLVPTMTATAPGHFVYLSSLGAAADQLVVYIGSVAGATSAAVLVDTATSPDHPRPTLDQLQAIATAALQG